MLAPALLSFAILSAGPFQVHVAADHPAPIFYTDDPLILSIQSAESWSGAATIYAELPTGAVYRETVSDVHLEPGRAHWLALGDLPVQRGPHRLTVTIDDAEPIVAEVTRIERPRIDRRGPIGVTITNHSVAGQHLLASLAIQAVRVDVRDSELLEHLAPLRSQAGLRIHARVSAQAIDPPALIESAKAWGSNVDVWEIVDVKSLGMYNALVTALLDGIPNARVAAGTAGLPSLMALYGEGSAHRPDFVVVHAAAVQLNVISTVRRALQHVGHERVPLFIEGNPSSDMVDLVRQIHRAAASDSVTLFIDEAALIRADRPMPAYSAVAAASGLADGLQWVGPVDGSLPTLYRLPAWSSHRWRAIGGIQEALASEASALPDAVELQGLFGNAYDSTAEGRMSRVRVIAAVGTDPAPMVTHWVARVNALASRIAEDADGMRQLPSESAAAMKRLTTYTLDRPLRFELFALVRALPALEERWHHGLVDAHEALPLIASTAEVVRLLAALSEEKDEPFLESFTTTRNRVRGILATSVEAYPEAPADSRLAFLRDEVGRVLAESQAWYDAGRETEARSLATLAEWRARCLEPAAAALADTAVVSTAPEENP